MTSRVLRRFGLPMLRLGKAVAIEPQRRGGQRRRGTRKVDEGLIRAAVNRVERDQPYWKRMDVYRRAAQQLGVSERTVRRYAAA